MNKKASLELSVNAIVILIIALVVLGLVIAFVTTKFASLSEEIRITEVTPPATSDIPLQFPGGNNKITLEKSKSTLMEIRIYNAESSAMMIQKGLFFDCSGQETPLKYELRTATPKVDEGKEVKIPINIQLKPEAKPGVYACSVNVYNKETDNNNNGCWDDTKRFSYVVTKSSDCSVIAAGLAGNTPTTKLLLSEPAFITVK
jgi:hypothetical protein